MTTVDAPSERRWLRSFISLAVVVGIFVGVLPRIADYGEVWTTVRGLSWWDVTTLTLVGLWNLATYWFVLPAALPGLRIGQAAVVNQASTAISNTMPAGSAIGVGVTVSMLTSWGFTVGSIGRSAVVTGVWNNFVKLGMPVLALVLVALEGGVTTARLLAAGTGAIVLAAAVVLFSMLLRSERLAGLLGTTAQRAVSALRRLVRRPPVEGWPEAAVSFRSDTVELLEHRWFRLTSLTIVSHGSLFLVLLVSLRHLGVDAAELSWIAAFAAFAFVRLVSALPITPGGVGVVELGYAAAMTIGLTDGAAAEVVAAILLFRAITYLLPIPLGAIAFLIWRANSSWRVVDNSHSEAPNPPSEPGRT
jgi:uncharacterized protein (TIRG00374 family)